MPILAAGYVGDYAENYATLNFKFSAFTTGWVPVALAGTPIVSVYTGSATGTEVTTGVTLAVDFDGITGLNNVLIDLSSAAFYAVGADYHVVITQGTIDSVEAAGTVVGSFSIENRKSKADVIEWLGTAAQAAQAGIPDTNAKNIAGNTNVANILSSWLFQGEINVADSGTTTTLVDAALTEADDYWNGSLLIFRVGTNAGYSAIVTDFDAASDTITFTPAVPNAVTTESYALIPGLGWGGNVQAWLGTAVGAATAGVPNVNATEISGDSTAADNLELQYDTTGLTGDTFPASQGQVGQLTVGSGGISTIATSGTTITTGTETLTFASTEELDGTTHDVAAAGGNTDFYYEFDVGSGGIATAFSWWGYPQSNNDTYAVLGYDWVSAGFKQIGTLPGGNGTTITEHTFIPAVNMTGTGANIGLVRLQFTSADGTEIFTDRVLCEFTQAVQGIANGSTVTLSAATTNTNLIGKEWILALGGRDITGSFISGATVTGTGTATAEYEFEECDMGAVTLDNDGHFERCALEGTFTVGQAGTFTFHQCFTESATAITIDFAAVGATAVHLLDFHGEVNFKNMAAGDTVHITGGGDITTETCTAGTIDHDGFFEYTDAGGNITEQQSDIKVAVDAVQVVTDKLDSAQAEPTGVPAVNETPLDKIAYQFMALRNKLLVSGTKKQFFDDGGAVEWEKDLADDGTDYTESEANAP